MQRGVFIYIIANFSCPELAGWVFIEAAWLPWGWDMPEVEGIGPISIRLASVARPLLPTPLSFLGFWMIKFFKKRLPRKKRRAIATKKLTGETKKDRNNRINWKKQIKIVKSQCQKILWSNLRRDFPWEWPPIQAHFGTDCLQLPCLHTSVWWTQPSRW